MAITYTWAVTGMKVTTVGSESDYVVQTYWTKTGTDENGNTGTFSGATPLDPNPDQPDFILRPTDARNCDWLDSAVGHRFIRAARKWCNCRADRA